MCLHYTFLIFLNTASRNKMSAIPVKNYRKKPHDFVKEVETNSCKITQK